MIKEDYCSYEVAKLLKEKGFNAECRASYTSYGKLFTTQIQQYVTNVLCSKGTLWECTAPTHQMAMKWLREEKRTSIIIEFDVTKRGYCPYVHQLDYDMDWVVKWRINTPMKYEEAVEAALKYTLENLI